ncbi:hypothetical protein Ancab_025551 [Ancistrocladus abbreviatus]
MAQDLEGQISTSVPIGVEGNSFTITLFEESTGKTIFFRGLDQLREIRKTHLANEDSNASTKVGGICSINKGIENLINVRVTSPDTNIGNDKMVVSKVSETNDGRSSRQRGLG